jgi:hypothetical protein
MSDNICPGCGKSHGDEFMDSIEDFTLMKRAAEVLDNEECEYSSAALYFFRSATTRTVELSIQEALAAGRNPVTDISNNLASLMAEIFAVGVMTSHHFADELKIPTVHVTEEMVQEERKHFEEVLSHRPPASEVVRDLLVKLGFTNPNVGVAAEVPKPKKEDDDPTPGMYL